MQGNTICLGDWSFNEISIKDKDLYSEFIKKSEYPVNLWSSSFAYIWAISQSKSRKILWKIIEDMLVTFVYTSRNTLYLLILPLGKGDSDKLNHILFNCLSYCYKWNKQDNSRTLVKTINENQLEFLKKSNKFDIYFKTVNLVGIERHFGIKELLELKGGKYSDIRNRINRFHREYPEAVISEYTKDDYDELIRLDEKWRDTAGQKYSNIFDQIYYKEILKNYDELEQIVLTMKTKGEIIGMVSGSILPNNQAWGSLIKFDNSIKGLSETLLIEFVKELNDRNPYLETINTGNDLGAGGLRSYKLKFNPILNFKRYRVYMKKQKK